MEIPALQYACRIFRRHVWLQELEAPAFIPKGIVFIAVVVVGPAVGWNSPSMLGC